MGSTSNWTGIHRTGDLAARGLSRRAMDRAVAEGRLVRLRKGWFAEATANPAVARAVAAGGVLSCASALAFHGGWDVTGGMVHVRAPRSRDVDLAPGLVECHLRTGREPLPDTGVDSLPVALSCARRCLDTEDFVVVADSLAHRGLMTPSQMRLALGPGGDADPWLARCDVAESGTESMVRQRLRARGIGVRSQVWVPGIGRVDLLVGERLVIEVDSRAHHTGEERYQADRRRDLALVAQGYLVVRLTYHDVAFGWEQVLPALLAIVANDLHRRRPRRTMAGMGR